MPRIYLDNAATSWPKPESVYQAVDHYQREVAAPVGRGVYAAAIASQGLVDAARRESPVGSVRRRPNKSCSLSTARTP